MPFIRNVKLNPSFGGFEVRYEYLEKGGDMHDDIRYVSTPTEVFEKPKDAMNRVIELSKSPNNLDFFNAAGEPLQSKTK